MKRFRIGILFLIVLLLGSLAMACSSRSICVPLARTMTDAATAAQEGNWDQALEKARQCQTQWEKHRHFLAAFTDHEPVEQIESLFSQLDLYGENRLAVDFSATCRQLRHWAQAIDESHGLKWWSLL